MRLKPCTGGLGMMRVMGFADDLILQLDQALGPGPRPTVTALHRPPLPWGGSKDGEFGAVQLSSGALGLAYLLLDNTLQHWANRPPAWLGGDALALARRWPEGQTAAERALGFAAANALSRHLLDRAGLVPPDATDSIAGLNPQPGEHIGMVGFFPPLVRPVTENGARLTVLELRADLVGSHPGYTVTLDPAALQACDKVLMTSTVLLNHTLDSVLAHCRQARVVAMIGPGAGLLPDGLFARGLTALGGSWVSDGPGFVKALAAGQPWGRCARKVLWQRGDYPGLPRG